MSKTPQTIKERLMEFLSVKRISKSEFGRRIGVSSAYVTSIRESIQPQKINLIREQFPDLNISWLITGEGEMLTTSPSRDEAPSMERVLAELTTQRDTLIAMLAEKDRQISQLLAMLNAKN